MLILDLHAAVQEAIDADDHALGDAARMTIDLDHLGMLCDDCTSDG